MRNIKLPHVKDSERIRIPQVPNVLLIENAVANGLPERIAKRFLDSPDLYLQLTLFYWDCENMREGDPEAALRVEFCRKQIQAMRGAEASLGNDPDVGPVGPLRGRMGIPEPVVRGPQAPLRGPQTPRKRELVRLSEKSRAPKYVLLPNGEQKRIA